MLKRQISAEEIAVKNNWIQEICQFRNLTNIGYDWTFDKIHNEENSELILENIVHTDNEWMINLVKDFLRRAGGRMAFIVYIVLDMNVV